MCHLRYYVDYMYEGELIRSYYESRAFAKRVAKKYNGTFVDTYVQGLIKVMRP